MLNRTRKAFTLLELMVAFIIMAILSAVAIPSLLGVVGNDQQTANKTSAIAQADASYYLGASVPTAPVYSKDANGVAYANYDAADSVAGIVAYSYGTTTVCVNVPTTADGSSPTFNSFGTVGTPC